jgi:hypothetical protein
MHLKPNNHVFGKLNLEGMIVIDFSDYTVDLVKFQEYLKKNLDGMK